MGSDKKVIHNPILSIIHMKIFCFTTMIAVFLLCCSFGIQAQTTQPKLNQVELMKQFLGSWKCDVAKDTICYWDIKSFGTGIEGYFKYVTNGKIVTEGKELWGYDKTIDKCILSEMIKGMDIELYLTWFISKNRCNMYPYGDILNPEKASSKWEVEFTSTDVLVETTFLNNNPVKIETYTRVK
jgi:hypothetical protein